MEQRFPPEAVFLLNTALQHVVREGTARGLSSYLASGLAVAGKTGTSDDLRDSWFAGFTGDKLAVVWLGRDDNTPTGMTGATGAMVIWGRIMQRLHPEPLELTEPPGIQWGSAADGDRLPFLSADTPVQGSGTGAAEPAERNTPGRNIFQTIRGWFH